ncbi:MAG: TIGR04076 family protein [Syntrophorhabdaceae bacterium]|nr:TIGR04076 family protein [Syntrophorhabdaceae bacterium]MDD5244160.1 TIGR04076 family protein [Syntrophorhabdaceae bacterium]
MAEVKEAGHRVTGTIKAVKGTCSAGHKVGDVIDLSGRNTGGMCGYLYHSLFPYLVMLQFGGGFPVEWGNPDVVEIDCMDKMNVVTIELRRIAEQK